MQNRNQTIEERLQIINDYIQRTMDALNATRQVVQGLSNSVNVQQQNVVPQQTVSGLTHSSFVPQFVQTPYGVVAINAQVPQQQFTQVQQYPQMQQVPVQVVGYNYGWPTGLNHTAFVQGPVSQVSPVAPWGVPVVQMQPQVQQQVQQQQPQFVPQGVPTQTF